MLSEQLGEVAGGQAVCKDRLSAGNGPQNDTNCSLSILEITSHGASAGGSILYCNGYLQHVSPLIGAGVHRLLYELAVNPPVSSTQMHQGHGRSLGPVPSTHLQKPPWEDASPSHPAKACKTARQASKIGPSGSRAQSQMGRALEEREAERCQSLLHGSTMERERPRLPRKVRPRVHR